MKFYTDKVNNLYLKDEDGVYVVIDSKTKPLYSRWSMDEKDLMKVRIN